jgi:hypothetical protein
VSAIVLFNQPPVGLDYLGVPLPGAPAVTHHTDPVVTAAFLRATRAMAAVVLWVEPTAQAERAAVDLIDVFARLRRQYPILALINQCEPAVGTALAEVVSLPWVHRVDGCSPGPDDVAAIERLLAATVAAGSSLVEAPRTLSRLWGTALGCYRHDRANTVRRLFLHASAGDLAEARRYLAEHGAAILARLLVLDRTLLSAAEWYLSARTLGTSNLASTVAARTKVVAQLVQGVTLPALGSFVESEARFRTQLASEWPRLSAEGGA